MRTHDEGPAMYDESTSCRYHDRGEYATANNYSLMNRRTEHHHSEEYRGLSSQHPYDRHPVGSIHHQQHNLSWRNTNRTTPSQHSLYHRHPDASIYAAAPGYSGTMQSAPPQSSSFGSHPSNHLSHAPSSSSRDLGDHLNSSSSGSPPMAAHHHHPYPPPGPGSMPPMMGYPGMQWAPVPQVTYIVDVQPNDVLSGRGGATNSHSGNRKFRSLVKEYQAQYLKAKKRDKPAVASLVVEQVRKRGGRFLRRTDRNQQGPVLWYDIGDDRAREKTCQALREGAPEIRRKKKKNNGSCDEDDTRQSESTYDTDRKLSSTFSSTDQTPDTVNDEHHHHFQPAPVPRTMVGNGRKDGFDSENFNQGHRTHLGSLVIRPSAKFIPGMKINSIHIDQLSSEDRKTYLQDFLPPDDSPLPDDDEDSKPNRRRAAKTLLSRHAFDENVPPQDQQARPFRKAPV